VEPNLAEAMPKPSKQTLGRGSRLCLPSFKPKSCLLLSFRRAHLALLQRLFYSLYGARLLRAFHTPRTSQPQ
jgi:hypothetical protein